MGSIRIICPNCKRILGDADNSVDCNINCRGCKKTVHICMKIVNYKDYINNNAKKEAK